MLTFATQAYKILELYLEQFNARSALISQTIEIPRDLMEAIASTVFAAKVGRWATTMIAIPVQCLTPCTFWDRVLALAAKSGHGMLEKA